MVTKLEIAPLTPERVDQAFPLYRELAPGLSLADWRLLAARFQGGGATPGRGFIAAQRAGYLRNLFSFEICPSLSGRVLMIDHVVILDPAAPRDLAGAMHDYVLALAQRYDCRLAVVSLTAAASWLQADWRDGDGSRGGVPLACLLVDRPPVSAETHEGRDLENR